MPQPSFIPCSRQLPLLTQREARQTRRSLNGDAEPSIYCSCSPKAILAQIQGTERFMCYDMPWACPLRENTRS